MYGPPPNVVQPSPLIVAQCRRRPPERLQLSRVRVPRQRKLCPALRQDHPPPRRRVVLEHYDECPRPRSGQRPTDVAALRMRRAAVVLHSRHHYRVAAAPYHAVRIVKQLPAEAPLHLLQLTLVGRLHVVRRVDVSRVIMIAQHREDAVTGPYPAQQGRKRAQLARLHVLQVARERYHIGSLSVDAVYPPAQHRGVARPVSARVQVAEVHYLVAVEGLRQVGRGKLHVPHLKPVEARRAAVHHRAHHRQCKDKPHQVAPIVALPPESAVRPPEERARRVDEFGGYHHA